MSSVEICQALSYLQKGWESKHQINCLSQLISPILKPPPHISLSSLGNILQASVLSFALPQFNGVDEITTSLLWSKIIMFTSQSANLTPSLPCIKLPESPPLLVLRVIPTPVGSPQPQPSLLLFLECPIQNSTQKLFHCLCPGCYTSLQA